MGKNGECLNPNIDVVATNDSGSESSILRAKNELEKKIKEGGECNKSDFLKKQLNDLESLNQEYKRFKENKFPKKTNKDIANLFNKVVDEIKIDSQISDELEQVKILLDSGLNQKSKIEDDLNGKYKDFYEIKGNLYFLKMKGLTLPLKLNSKENIHKAIEYTLNAIKILEGYPKNQKLYLARDSFSENFGLTGNTKSYLEQNPELHLWDIAIDQPYQPQIIDDKIVLKDDFKNIFNPKIVYTGLDQYMNFLEKLRK